MKSIENFKEKLEEEEKAELTVEKYVRDCKAFLKWLKENERGLSKDTVLMYKEELLKTHEISGVNSILSSLNAYFSYLGENGLKVKIIKRQKKSFREKEKELTKEEYERLLKAALRNENEKLYYLMQTVCLSGVRVSEIKYITVEAVERKEAVINNKGKVRMILLPDKLCKELTGYIKRQKIKRGSVFVTRTGKPLDRSNIWKMMKSLCKSANVSEKKVFPHNLRHLFAVTFYSIHKDIVRLADILGHATVNTTRIYTMETGDVHRRQLDKLCRLLI